MVRKVSVHKRKHSVRKHKHHSRKQKHHSRKHHKKTAKRVQRGGMAPIGSGDYDLISGAMRTQAEVAPLDRYMAELPAVITRPQAGGTRYKHRGQKRTQRRRRQHGGMGPAAGPYTLLPENMRAAAYPVEQQRGGMAPVSSGLLLDDSMYRQAAQPTPQQLAAMASVSATQRGGMAPIGSGLLLPGGVVAGVNRQFMDESTVNPIYGQFKGAQ